MVSFQELAKRLLSIQWYSKGDTKQQQKLVNKLDLLIVPYAFLAYWVKYIDQANISKLCQTLSTFVLLISSR